MAARTTLDVGWVGTPYGPDPHATAGQRGSQLLARRRSVPARGGVIIERTRQRLEAKAVMRAGVPADWLAKNWRRSKRDSKRA